MTQTQAKNILDYVSNFQSKSESIKRYEGNPYVKGDNIAEHLSRLARLLIAISQDLKKEFSDQPNIVENVLITLHIHDDDEVIDGFDIPTALKNHNVKDDDEIQKFGESVRVLGETTSIYLTSLFESFRRKNSLAAKIAKALDNIAGNQLVIEQRIGLINPHQAKFAIEYAEKIKGFSKVTDMLADAQVEQIMTAREELQNNPAIVRDIIVAQGIAYSNDLLEKCMQLLYVDINSLVLVKEKININLGEL